MQKKPINACSQNNSAEKRTTARQSCTHHCFVYQKSLILTILVIYYAVGYLGINAINAHRNRYYDFSLPFEQSIPFVPVFIFGYGLAFILIIMLFFSIENMEEMNKITKGFMVITIICFGIFLLFPSKMLHRPDIQASGDFILEFVSFYFWVDKPHNLFPSMHLSMSVFPAIHLLKKDGFQGWIAVFMAFLVAFSVLLVKQHYVLDVISGTLIGWFGYRMGFSGNTGKDNPQEP